MQRAAAATPGWELSVDVKTACLGVLACGDATGYEIRKQFEEGPFSHFFDAGFGSIYPALTRLTEDGLASCTEFPQDKRPDKKVYAITTKGWDVLLDQMMERPERDKVRSAFTFMLFFAEMLPAGWVEKVVDERVAWYRDTIAMLRDKKPSIARTDHAITLEFGLTVYQCAADFLERNKHRLVEAARARAADGTGDGVGGDEASGAARKTPETT